MNSTRLIIDLRSDTMTRPTPAMRQVMCAAEVGDDTVGEDPTVNRLEELCCELFGKPAAMFCCSGTQANQAAIWAHCRPGDELLIEELGHIARYEAGAPAALTGVTLRRIPGSRGMLDLTHLAEHVPESDLHYPVSRLLCLENTTNIGGGRAWPLAQLKSVTAWGREHQLRLHLDGARLLNACHAERYSPATVAGLFDTVSLCFSKGLGCPLGSILVGDEETIARARRARKIFGGALRQAGIVAAAAVYALEHHVERLGDDHRRANRLAELLSDIPGLYVESDAPPTNMIFFQLDPQSGLTARQFVEAASEQGVLLYDISPQRLRAVTHLDVDDPMIDRAAEVFKTIMQSHHEKFAQ